MKTVIIPLSETLELSLIINGPRGAHVPGRGVVSDIDYAKTFADRISMEIKIKEIGTLETRSDITILVNGPAGDDVIFVGHLLKTCRHSGYIKGQLRPNMKLIETEKKEVGE